MTFEDFNLPKAVLNALDDAAFTKPTTIQAKAFPFIMSGRDVLGIAQTGTGKTLAYVLPCLKQWKFSKDKSPTVLILVPTRELVAQVVTSIETMTKYMDVRVGGVFGGVTMSRHVTLVSGGLDILVATPGRLLDLALGGAIKLKSVKKLIIDEVDEMLDLGFRPQLARVFDLLPPKRQNIMFSATMTEPIELIIDTYFNAPEKIEAAPTGTPLENIVQSAYHVPNFNTKVNLLKILLRQEEMQKVLVFASTKRLADKVWTAIEGSFTDKVGIIHSDKAQNVRFRTVNQFHDGEIRYLVATDIIARGIDISEVSHVINFDIPEEPESYIHRIGRTGRADKKGIAISFINEKEEEYQRAIEELMHQSIEIMPNPEVLVISTVLIDDEIPKKITGASVELKLAKKEEGNAAFHEKSDKRKKVNNKIRRPEAMRKKYGKPQTRGAKQKKKK
jgi:ATP-dependent RNA helicase RhlE